MNKKTSIIASEEEVTKALYRMQAKELIALFIFRGREEIAKEKEDEEKRKETLTNMN